MSKNIEISDAGADTFVMGSAILIHDIIIKQFLLFVTYFLTFTTCRKNQDK